MEHNRGQRQQHNASIVVTEVDKRDETTLTSEEIRSVDLSVVKLCLSEGISQLVTQLKTFVKNEEEILNLLNYLKVS